MNWQDMSRSEKTQMIRDAVARGLSAGQIAAKLTGISRNGIIGFARRHGIRLTGKPGGKPGKRRPAPPRAAGVKVVQGPASVPDIRPEPVLVDPDAWRPLPGRAPIPFMKLNGDTCRWPVEGGRFCGHGVARGPYCEPHGAIAFPGAA